MRYSYGGPFDVPSNASESEKLSPVDILNIRLSSNCDEYFARGPSSVRD